MSKVALAGRTSAALLAVTVAGCAVQRPAPSRTPAALVPASAAAASAAPAARAPVTRFARDYPVGDLVGADPSTTHSLPDFARYVRETVDPGSWADDGGDVGTMDADESTVVLHVVQTPANHRKIAALLAGLRKPATRP